MRNTIALILILFVAVVSSTYAVFRIPYDAGGAVPALLIMLCILAALLVLPGRKS